MLDRSLLLCYLLPMLVAVGMAKQSMAVQGGTTCSLRDDRTNCLLLTSKITSDTLRHSCFHPPPPPPRNRESYVPYAQVIFVDNIKVPLMIQKSDGGFGYGTTDMAAIRHRIHEEKCDFLVYVTDLGQAPHFQQVFGAAKKAGFWNV